MRDPIALLMQLRMKLLSGQDKQLAIEEIRLSARPEDTMLLIGVKVFSGEEVDDYHKGRFEAWIDTLVMRTYHRLPESDRAVRRVAERKPYPWEMR